MPTFAFSGGSGTPPKTFGQQDNFVISGTWELNDTWTIKMTSTSGAFTLGVGNLGNINPTYCTKFKNRVYIAMGSQFNFSENSDPSSWEQQNPGAGFISFLSQMGGQDTVQTFSHLQQNLVVFGKNSIQLWNVDSDPSQFSMVQAMDNAGTPAPQSVQNLGDFDVMYLDPTGFRSTRARELTQNAEIDDVGTAIDDLVQFALQNYDATKTCSIVDPLTKNYWCYLNGSIYVYSRHRYSKISAWSTFSCIDDSNQVFTPQKFVVFNNRVYCRSTEGKHILYGGVNGNTYDQYSQVTLQLPWLDGKSPEMFKQASAINAVVQGKWNIFVSMNPQQTAWPADPVYAGGSATVPNELLDST